MKNLVLVKSGEYTPNLFNELSHVVNNSGSGCFSELLRFVKRTDYTFRLYRNSKSAEATGDLAVVTFGYDTAKDAKDPAEFFPVDIKLMQSALQSHEFVLLGSIVKSDVSDLEILPSLRYITRDSTGRIIDAVTGELLIDPSNLIDGPKADTVISMIGMVKAGPLPIYYLILDNGSVGRIDFIEYFDDYSNSTIFPVQDYDGTIAEHLMHLKFGPEVTKIGKNHLFVKGNSTILEFFTEQWTDFLDKHTLQMLPNPKITGSCKHIVDGPRIHLTINKPISTLRVEFDLGRFFSVVQAQEKLVVEFVIYADS